METEQRSFHLFEPDQDAVFVRRPNRFLIIARLCGSADAALPEAGGEVPCHCPNPGRLLEFVIPGTRLILERRRSAQAGAGNVGAGIAGAGKAKTVWTAVGVHYRGAVVPLFSARANQTTREAILPAIIGDITEIHPEFVLGHSRFDFMVVDGKGQRHLVEVKACSLVEEGVAMFPDAPSLRAAKHVEELAELSGRGYRCHVLFVIVHGDPRVFIPNLHTDPDFAQALYRCADRLDVHAALIEADARGRGILVRADVPVDLSWGALAAENRGSYMVALEIAEPSTVSVGSLGELRFDPGWYVFAGSAQRGLRQRLARHLRKVRKATHWHLDYLTPRAVKIIGLPIASYENLECVLAAGLRAICGEAVDGFGSSDCACPGHLFRFGGPPLKDRRFLELLFHFRHSLHRPVK